MKLTKDWQRLISFGKIQKPNITKEPARDICPLAKVKAIRTNESFLLQVQTKTPFTVHQQYTH